MRIRHLTIYAGPAGTFGIGTVRDVNDTEAKALIAGHYAEAVPAATESAALRQPEQAVAPRPQPAGAVHPPPAASAGRSGPYEARHKKFGAWYVHDAGGNPVNAQSLKRAEAEALASRLNAEYAAKGKETVTG